MTSSVAKKIIKFIFNGNKYYKTNTNITLKYQKWKIKVEIHFLYQ